jgi:hypothetical protein
MVAVKQLSLKTSIFVVVWRVCRQGKARFSPRQDPHPVPGLLLGAAVTIILTLFRFEKI